MILNNLQPYYEHFECAKKDAPHLVCIPGVGCNSWIYRPFLPLLIDHYHLTIMNLPGVGDTPKWQELTVDSITNLVIDVCNELDIDNPSIIGHSMGGFVAQNLAIKAFDVPKLVLMSTSYGATTLDRDSMSLMQRISAKSWGHNIHLHPAVLYEFLISDHTRKKNPHFFKMLKENFGAREPDEKVIWQHFFCGMSYSSLTQAHRIESDALVIQGAEDYIVSNQSARLLAGQLPNAKYMEVQEAGHFVFLENPEVLLRAVDFLLGSDVNAEKVSDAPNNNFFAQAEENSWRFKQTQLMQFYNPETFDILKWLAKL